MHHHDYEYEPDYDVVTFGSPDYRHVLYLYERPNTDQDKFINWFINNFNDCEIKILYKDNYQVSFRFMNEDEYLMFKFYIACKQTNT